MSNDAVKELFDRYKVISQEIQTLQQDRRELLEEFKDRISPKAFRAALGAARAKARLKPHEANEFDLAMEALLDEMSIEDVN